jgi:pyruvate dehydrogenase E2 component (dihydrolipoamide acetyltransferase)
VGDWVKVPVVMPKLGYDMESGRIVSWLKQPGDDVTRGEPIAEIETDKATIEIEAKATGRLVEIVRPPGEEVIVQEVIAYIEEA